LVKAYKGLFILSENKEDKLFIEDILYQISEKLSQKSIVLRLNLRSKNKKFDEKYTCNWRDFSLWTNATPQIRIANANSIAFYCAR